MASFTLWMLPHKRRWERIVAGFQDLHNDAGNWSTGKVGQGILIGTNRSISAPRLIEWRGKMITKQEMMDLSILEAMKIYRVHYWDAIHGDQINSQALADILADMKSSAGGAAVVQMQKTLNSFGENLAMDGAFGSKSVTALNRQISKRGEARIFNVFREYMTDYYKKLNNPHFEEQWISSLDEDYPPMDEGQTFWTAGNITFIVIIILLVSYAAYQFKTSKLDQVDG